MVNAYAHEHVVKIEITELIKIIKSWPGILSIKVFTNIAYCSKNGALNSISNPNSEILKRYCTLLTLSTTLCDRDGNNSIQWYMIL